VYMSKQQLEKVELLWSRACPFNCAGCAMKKAVNYNDSGTIEEWKRGFENIKALGCEFVAIYGAEPLVRFNSLVDIIRLIHTVGMECTVITALYAKDKVQELIDKSGLNSITISYDGIAEDDRTTKGMNGLKLLKDIEVDDKAVCCTISKLNQTRLIQTMDEVLDTGYWFLFDIAHKANQPAQVSKCSDTLEPVEANWLKQFLTAAIERKEDGAKIHPSIHWMTYLKEHYADGPGDVARNVWHCYDENTATLGWITVEFNGLVYPCDDYQIPIVNPATSHALRIWTLNEIDVETLVKERNRIVRPCRGCAWNTHADAMSITSGEIDRGTYVHNLFGEDHA